ncbi:TetR/AcrR family transcriptional regulator [Paraburkholderia elongata]|uniref:TetR family transcriptional regulator n=1 Tax=Paraburkholderia elongata TaxID=2675747 RepID=A0A972NRU2_9BURK|nr:TetR/AcrR family transcriptional regulator [Paraburkholderia elongata]NPT57263.1 TetR family transcriptional regulator [Paraburkholderia elongata]
MKRERLTHAQRKERTREHLFEAARTMFVKKGLAATSVEDIAEAAGYTRGAFYSNFDGKPELLLELLRRDHDSARANLRAIMEEGGTPAGTTARAIAYYSRYFRDQDFFLLWVEAKLLAYRDAGFQESFNAFQNEKLGQVSAYIRTFSERNGSSLPLQADALALGLVSLCDGVQFFRLCDPQMVSDKVMQTVLAGFFSCVSRRQSEEIPQADHRAGVPERGRGRRTPTTGADNIHD